MKGYLFSVSHLIPALALILLCQGCKKDSGGNAVAAFEISEPNPAMGEAVTFTNRSEHSTYFRWDFGDGQTSADRNPVHSYDFPGDFRVMLKAFGSANSDTATAWISVKVPQEMMTIHEGTGIDGLNLGINWSTMQESYPPTDTGFYSNYLEQYNIYLNQVYYPDKGIAAIFLSEKNYIANGDLLIVIILIPPYPGFTDKGIAVGSRMSKVRDIYGDPVAENDTIDYLSYTYPDRGIDFHAYKRVDSRLVYEIDVYEADIPSGSRKGLGLTASSLLKYTRRPVRHCQNESAIESQCLCKTPV